MAETDFPYVPPDRFDPESRVYWQPIGPIVGVNRDEEQGTPRYVLNCQSGHRVLLYVLAPSTIRVRFDPNENHRFDPPRSPAVVSNRLMDRFTLEHAVDQDTLTINTDALRVCVNLRHYKLTVYYPDGQLIHSDADNYNTVYIPGQQVIAAFKKIPTGAKFFGFGEKAGITLDRRAVPRWHFGEGWVPGGNWAWLSGPKIERAPARMTFFNFDNWGYTRGNWTTNKDERAGPLNPNVPVYQSSPVWLEHNPNPVSWNAGRAYTVGTIFDNTAQSYVNLAQGDQYYFGAQRGEMNYYLLFGADAADVLRSLVQITGRANLPPRWVWGYHQGGYGPNYNRRDALRTVADEYRAANIPIDGLHIDIDILDNYRNFTTSPSRFPDPRALFEILHKRGYKLSTNVTPLVSIEPDENGKPNSYDPLKTGNIINAFVSNRRFDRTGTDHPFVGRVNYGATRQPLGQYPDFGTSNVQDWWGDLYKFWTDLGIDMIWQDMTTPCFGDGGDANPNLFSSLPMNCEVWNNEDNLYGGRQRATRVPFARVRNLYSYNLSKATFDGLTKLRPDARNFIIARGGFLGDHRHSGIWSGDNMSNWEYLILNIPQVLNMGLSGQPIAGADIGGFGGDQCSAEMLVRWLTLGAFLPWFRNHYGHYDGTKRYQEPYKYPEPVPSVCRKYIELRYRLIQVFYDAMWENCISGAPIIRPLFWNSKDLRVFDEHDWWYWKGSEGFYYGTSRVDDQFMLGRDLLIAPIIIPTSATGVPERPVYLPADCSWYCFKGNKFRLEPPVRGGQEFTYRAPWDDGGSFFNNVPVYVRAGAILPHRELEQYFGERNGAAIGNPITFSVYPGADGFYRAFLDDGLSTDAERLRKLRVVEIKSQWNAGTVTIDFNRTLDAFAPREPFFFVAILRPGRIKKVYRSTNSRREMLQMIDLGDDEAEATSLYNSPEEVFYYNRNLDITFIKVYDKDSRISIEAG